EAPRVLVVMALPSFVMDMILRSCCVEDEQGRGYPLYTNVRRKRAVFHSAYPSIRSSPWFPDAPCARRGRQRAGTALYLTSERDLHAAQVERELESEPANRLSARILPTMAIFRVEK